MGAHKKTRILSTHSRCSLYCLASAPAPLRALHLVRPMMTQGSVVTGTVAIIMLMCTVTVRTCCIAILTPRITPQASQHRRENV